MNNLPCLCLWLLIVGSVSAQQVGPVFEAQSLIPGTNLHRCGTPTVMQGAGGFGADNPDCDSFQTNPTAAYAPSAIWRIPVVVHVISNTTGQGNLTDAAVQSQIAILNEDFRAVAGTPGAPGVDAKIEFFLATTDPAGAATTGIRRYINSTWYADSGSYWLTIAWNPQRYLNIYTNSCGGGGVLGYVPWLPQNGAPGTSADRVVILSSAFGRNASGGAPYNQGRSCTHEVGHYLGLYHTFQGGCATASCYTTGDTICDTNSESTARFGCPVGAVSCVAADPIRNYMDYTDDSCMTGFSQEQARRMRCTMLSHRPSLYVLAGPVASATLRTGAGNLNANFSASAPRLGTTATASVVTFGTGFSAAAVYGFTGAATVPFDAYTILLNTNSIAVLQLPLQVGSIVNTWTYSVPNDIALAGLPMKTQAVLFGANFGLTNAMDLVIGN